MQSLNSIGEHSHPSTGNSLLKFIKSHCGMATIFNLHFFLSTAAMYTISSNLGLGTMVDAQSRAVLLEIGLSSGVLASLLASHFFIKRELLELATVGTVFGSILGATLVLT